MCRIAGMVSGSFQPVEMREKVALMCVALKHGGPDDEGMYCDEEHKVVLGHRRLSIIDLSKKGHQPMTDNCTSAWITFNGEIYNYPELKRELLTLGAKFNSETDTEVILAAYLFWGTDAFARLRGMFAFAVYDISKSLLFLVRDSTGVKPLYYHIANDGLSFSSEVKALKAAGIAMTIDEEWMVRFLAFGHVPDPHTTLKKVYSLPKGAFLCWNVVNASHYTRSYCKEPERTEIFDKKIAREYVADGLLAAIKRQLLADAPIGVFLSGGVDSSLITLLASQEKGDNLKTISIYFNEKSYDEQVYQRIILKNITGQKFSHLVTQQDFEYFFPQIISDMDMPTTDGINTWFISKYAHEDGLKAVLSGVGADELFGGYPSFNRIKYLRLLRGIPSSFFKNTRYITADRYKKISFLYHDHILADYLFLRGLFTPVDIAQILNTDTKQVNDILFNTSDIRQSRKYDREQASWFEENIYMQNQLLRDTDVMSMSHSLEVRVPFLDEDFQKMVKSIAPAIRFDGKHPKQLLIDSFADKLPAAIWNRPKMGFTFPLQKWMQSFEEISKEDGYKNKYSRQIIRKFKAGEMHWSKVFALYHIQKHA